MVADRLRRLTGVGIGPGRILVRLPVNDDIVVAGQALPMAGRVRLAGPEELRFDRLAWEVVIALDDDARVALG